MKIHALIRASNLITREPELMILKRAVKEDENGARVGFT
jgi:hypothetical protein